MRILLLVPLLLAIAACASGRAIEVTSVSDATQFTNAETMTVTLTNFEFTPTTLRLKAGTPYALRIQNKGSAGHDFSAPEFLESSQILSTDAALVNKGGIDVAEGDSATVHLVPSAGTYDLVCTHLGHAALGMTGTIIVK